MCPWVGLLNLDGTALCLFKATKVSEMMVVEGPGGSATAASSAGDGAQG